MNKAIITYAAGEHAKLLEISRPTFQRFADAHGYDLLVGEKKCDRPGAWNKVPLLLEALQRYEIAVWFDADLVVVDASEDFPFIGSQGSQNPVHALVRHFSYMSEIPNSGVWILTRAAIPLLEQMWTLEVFMNHGWWEQAALMTCMGYSVPPEGTMFDRTCCRCVYPKWVPQWLRVEWNSHPNYRADKPRIVHCSYQDWTVRVSTMSELVVSAEYRYPEWPRKDFS